GPGPVEQGGAGVPAGVAAGREDSAVLVLTARRGPSRPWYVRRPDPTRGRPSPLGLQPTGSAPLPSETIAFAGRCREGSSVGTPSARSTRRFRWNSRGTPPMDGKTRSLAPRPEYLI